MTALGRGVIASLFLTACATEPEVLDISGSWSYSDSSVDSLSGTVCSEGSCSTVSFALCSSHGTLGLAQRDEGIAGVLERFGECTDSAGTRLYGDSDRLTVDGGQLTDRSLWFTTGSRVLPAWCRYTGEVVGTPPTRMSGSLVCGRDSDRTGVWAVER